MRPTGDQELEGSTLPGRLQSFVEIDHEIFSTDILSLPLEMKVTIFRQKLTNALPGHLSVSGETLCTIPANRLED